MKKQLCFAAGSMAFSLGFIGIFLPLLPTTPFMILAAGCFAKSSPRFHQALLNNRYIGADLRRWESERTMLRATKKRATWVILITFTISIAILYDRHWLQLMLVGIAAVLLFFMWRIPEQKVKS
ncbi:MULTISPECIES: YbaN family protein [Thiomicrorhabdus]|uniref:Inner membrane protein n=1 Tax=Thiomicrorhabdus heinhorstiae TaxID=2748010 RepID=A0ABS0BZ82_9GAMM|nr:MULTISPECIES: YbaN family protein [Thiomicrorhabdus]MBF6058146.1 YbaN family protein [Thiomicrorhabdus heinhorstiae]